MSPVEHVRPSSRNRKQLLLKLGVFLLLGAIVNVAVAWGLAVFKLAGPSSSLIYGWDSPDHRQYAGSTGTCVAWRYGTLGTEVVAAAWGTRDWWMGPAPDIDVRDIIPNWATFVWPSNDERMQMDGLRVAMAHGWPALSMRSTLQTRDFATSFGPRPVAQTTTAIGLQWGDRNVEVLSPEAYVIVRPIRAMLPIQPLWSGFAINTIFYAALLWVLFCVPCKIRRLVRIRRGCCPACGFIIAPDTCANGLCSECGATLPERLRTQPT